MQGWMEKCLSAGGKEVLIKSVAQAIPTYSMACFKLPRGLCEHINGLIRKFWWGSKNGERKTAWVSWKTMSKPKFMGGLGFRDIELFNLALLARQAWRLLQKPESLSARVLKARYFPNTDLLQANLGSAPSQVWRSLVEGRDILQLGLVRRIGKGADTNVWQDNWIPRDYKLRPICVRSLNPPVLVSELINPATRSWNKHALTEHFIVADVEAILNIPLSTQMQEDFWAWHYDRCGIFSVRSAYRMICAIKTQQEDWLEHRPSHSNIAASKNSWTQLWKVRIPSKIRVFVWRLAHTFIPTGIVRHERRMADTPACSLCGAVEDTWRHSLLNCLLARCVWALEDHDLVGHVISNQTEDPKLWLFWLFETTNQQDLARVLVTMWAIWWARRKAIHENEYQSPLSTMCFINRFMEDLEIANMRSPQKIKGSTARPHAKVWLPPPGDAAKFNCDGGLSSLGEKGAAGVVCRDKNGKYLGASAVVYEGLSDPASLEAQACSEALALARDLNLQELVIASDCVEVITNISNAGSPSYAPIRREIQTSRANFTSVSFRFESRVNNFEAHSLAKGAASLAVGRHVWLGVLPDIACIPDVLNFE